MSLCFNPLAPFIEARTVRKLSRNPPQKFQSTSPVYRGQNLYSLKNQKSVKLFQSTSPVYRGQNPYADITAKSPNSFNPLAPFIEARTRKKQKAPISTQFQSTSPVYRGQNTGLETTYKGFMVSIHQPRLQRLEPIFKALDEGLKVSIHQPRLQRLELKLLSQLLHQVSFNPLAPFIEARTNFMHRQTIT